MPKIILRITTLLLLPGLLVDPTLAAAFTPSRPANTIVSVYTSAVSAEAFAVIPRWLRRFSWRTSTGERSLFQATRAPSFENEPQHHGYFSEWIDPSNRPAVIRLTAALAYLRAKTLREAGHTPQSVHTAVYLHRMQRVLEQILDGQYPYKPLALFAAWSETGRILHGVRILIQTEEYGLDKPVESETVIGLAHQNKGIAQYLLIHSLKWMLEHGYQGGLIAIDETNHASRAVLDRVQQQTGVTFQRAPRQDVPQSDGSVRRVYLYRISSFPGIGFLLAAGWFESNPMTPFLLAVGIFLVAVFLHHFLSQLRNTVEGPVQESWARTLDLKYLRSLGAPQMNSKWSDWGARRWIDHSLEAEQASALHRTTLIDFYSQSVGTVLKQLQPTATEAALESHLKALRQTAEKRIDAYLAPNARQVTRAPMHQSLPGVAGDLIFNFAEGFMRIDFQTSDGSWVNTLQPLMRSYNERLVRIDSDQIKRSYFYFLEAPPVIEDSLPTEKPSIPAPSLEERLASLIHGTYVPATPPAPNPKRNAASEPVLSPKLEPFVQALNQFLETPTEENALGVQKRFKSLFDFLLGYESDQAYAEFRRFQEIHRHTYYQRWIQRINAQSDPTLNAKVYVNRPLSDQDRGAIPSSNRDMIVKLRSIHPNNSEEAWRNYLRKEIRDTAKKIGNSKDLADLLTHLQGQMEYFYRGEKRDLSLQESTPSQPTSAERAERSRGFSERIELFLKDPTEGFQPVRTWFPPFVAAIVQESFTEEELAAALSEIEHLRGSFSKQVIASRPSEEPHNRESIALRDKVNERFLMPKTHTEYMAAISQEEWLTALRNRIARTGQKAKDIFFGSRPHAERVAALVELMNTLALYQEGMVELKRRAGPWAVSAIGSGMPQLLIVSSQYNPARNPTDLQLLEYVNGTRPAYGLRYHLISTPDARSALERLRHESFAGVILALTAEENAPLAKEIRGLHPKLPVVIKQPKMTPMGLADRIRSSMVIAHSAAATPPPSSTAEHFNLSTWQDQIKSTAQQWQSWGWVDQTHEWIAHLLDVRAQVDQWLGTDELNRAQRRRTDRAHLLLTAFAELISHTIQTSENALTFRFLNRMRLVDFFVGPQKHPVGVAISTTEDLPHLLLEFTHKEGYIGHIVMALGTSGLPVFSMSTARPRTPEDVKEESKDILLAPTELKTLWSSGEDFAVFIQRFVNALTTKPSSPEGPSATSGSASGPLIMSLILAVMLNVAAGQNPTVARPIQTAA